MQNRRTLRMLVLSIFLAVCTSTSMAEELTILTEEWPPISFSRNGMPAGLGVEVVQEILARLKWSETIEIVPWARGWKIALELPNIVLFTMTRTPERENLFTLIGPVAIGTTNFYAKKGADIHITSLEDAKNIKSIGVYRSAVEEQLLEKAGFRNLDVTTEPLQSAKKLMANRITLWCNANLTAGTILQQAGYSLEDVENVFTLQENHLYIAFSRGSSEEVVQQWFDALKAIKEDGTFAKIYHKWLPGEIPPLKVERLGTLAF